MFMDFVSLMSYTIYSLDSVLSLNNPDLIVSDTSSIASDTSSVISDTGTEHDFSDNILQEFAEKQSSGTLTHEDINSYAEERRIAAFDKCNTMSDELLDDNSGSNSEANSPNTVVELVKDELTREQTRIDTINAF